jgi:hypothetical protein
VKKFETPCTKAYASDIWYKFTEFSEKNFSLNLFYCGKFLTVILFITRQIFYRIDDLHVYKRKFFDITIRLTGNCDSGELSYVTGYVVSMWQGQSSIK